MYAERIITHINIIVLLKFNNTVCSIDENLNHKYISKVKMQILKIIDICKLTHVTSLISKIIKYNALG